MIRQLTFFTFGSLILMAAGFGGQAEAQEKPKRHDWPSPDYEIEDAAPAALPILDESATLSDYLVYAALNNPGLESSFNRWKASLERISQASTLPDPKFTYAYFINSVETRVGPQIQKFGLHQAFPWFGTLKLRSEVASEAARAAFEDYQADKLDLYFNVKKVFYEYYYLYRAISITEENIELLKHLESVARLEHRAGAPQASVIKAQVELGKLDDRVRSFQDLRGPIAAKLNAALNREPNAPIGWPKTAIPSKAIKLEEDLFESLISGSPQLRALDRLIAKEEQAVALAKKEFYPRFVLGVDYIDTDEALMPATPDSGKDPIIAKIALDIPLWRGKYKAGVEGASRRLDMAEQTRDNKANVLEANLYMAMFRFRDAERKLDLYGDTLVPQAEQALKVTEEAYRSGGMDFLNLIDAERLLLEFQLARERALADREIALAEVEMLVGQPLENVIAE